MFGYIYLTENIINGKCYIGKHKSSIFDEEYKGSGTYLNKAFKKYGKDNFITTVIEWCLTEDDLNKREKYYIDKCDAINSKCFYNLIDGGQGGWAYVNNQGFNVHHNSFSHSEETKEKMRIAALNRKPSSKETNMKKANHRGNHPKAKKIYCPELDKEWSCIRDASEELNINYSTLVYHVSYGIKYDDKYLFIKL